MAIIKELYHKKNFEKLFNCLITYKLSLKKLENDAPKLKAIEFIDKLLHKSISNSDICEECLQFSKGSIKIKELIYKYADYKEENLIDFNAFCLLDNISLEYKRHC